MRTFKQDDYVITTLIVPSIFHLLLDTMGYASDDAMISQLQSILSIADGLKEATASSRLSSHSRVVISTDSFAVTLPAPPSLLPSLLAVGATHEAAAAASRTYQLYTERLGQYIRQSIIAACHEIAELPRAPPMPLSDGLMKKVASAATEVYLSRIRHWKDDVIHRVKERSVTSTKAAARNSHAFKYVSVAPVKLQLSLIYLAAGICSTIRTLFSKKTHSRRMRTRRFSPRSQTWSTGKFMWG